MHILTLVVSFTYSIPRFQWPRVMVELLEVTATRRLTQATALFRDDIYEDGLMSAFMNHVSRWRHVLSDVCRSIDGYRAPPVIPPECWNEVCDSYAALIDHRRLWGSVMQQLLLLHVPSPITPAFRHLHRGPIDRAALRRRRASVPLRIALANKLTARCVRRSLLTAFNQSIV